MKNAAKTAFLLCSSLIGAGFATGKEVCEYFPPNGILGLINAVFSCALMSIFTYFIIRHGKRISENIIYRMLLFLFLVCSVSAMLAGADVLPFGRIVLLAAVLITYTAGLGGIETAAVVLTPLMAAYILLSAITRGCTLPPVTNAAAHPFIYSGYNLISFPILLKNIKVEKPRAAAGIMFAIMAPLICGVYMLSQNYSDFELPLFSAVGGGFFCSAMLFSAMYTTAACSAFCMSDIAGKNYGYFGILLSFGTSFFGFGNIVSSGYRIFGIIGFSLCILCFAKQFKNKNGDIL